MDQTQPAERIVVLETALREIHDFSHCVAMAGPANTPDLPTAWTKFMKISAMATKALTSK